MTEAEFERRQQAANLNTNAAPLIEGTTATTEAPLAEPIGATYAAVEVESRSATGGTAKGRGARAKPVKPRRVQRMFALEEDLDKKLWLYAIHVGKDRSEVINDLLRPLVASMVLYDSRDRRGSRAVEE